jgi:spermidine/putrescine transport system ATP-binding protein
MRECRPVADVKRQDLTPSVEIRGLSKRFGDVLAVDSISLDIRRGEFFSLLGPSGCGKTTLLRMIGGFELPSAGSLRIRGTDMTRTPPYLRPVNTVFQHYALFPHLTVEENVAFGLRYRKPDRPAQERRERVAQTLALVQLSGFEKRKPQELSGGQRQRVALARALALEPEVLLLDEPLGALDQKLRKEVQVQLKHLQRELGITFVFVTHDQEEALTMSDRIAVMNRGRVEQTGDAAAVFERPATEFVANFMGASNFFAGRVREAGPGAVTVDLAGGGQARIPVDGGPDAYRPADEVRFVVRPEKLDLRSRDLSRHGVPSVAVTVEERVYQGISTIWVVRDAAGGRFVVYEQNEKPFAESSRFAVGGRAFVCWNPRHAVLIPMEAGRT